MAGAVTSAAEFLSTPSARRATSAAGAHRGGNGRFLSTPSARRATSEVSSDESAQDNFYPRPPRGGRRHATGNHCKASRFLSTPSARRATCQPRPGSRPDQFLSTPSARRATRVYLKVCYAGRFLSTPSARRATSRKLLTERYAIISIHALREEGDAGIHRCRSWGKPISIHALREEGDGWAGFVLLQTGLISIHALREEGDHPARPYLPTGTHFYPRPPRGGRRTTWMEQNDTEIFLSTPSARRATRASFSRSFWI